MRRGRKEKLPAVAKPNKKDQSNSLVILPIREVEKPAMGTWLFNLWQRRRILWVKLERQASHARLRLKGHSLIIPFEIKITNGCRGGGKRKIGQLRQTRADKMSYISSSTKVRFPKGYNLRLDSSFDESEKPNVSADFGKSSVGCQIRLLRLKMLVIV